MRSFRVGTVQRLCKHSDRIRHFSAQNMQREGTQALFIAHCKRLFKGCKLLCPFLVRSCNEISLCFAEKPRRKIHLFVKQKPLHQISRQKIQRTDHRAKQHDHCFQQIRLCTYRLRYFCMPCSCVSTPVVLRCSFPAAQQPGQKVAPAGQQVQQYHPQKAFFCRRHAVISSSDTICALMPACAS